MTRRQHLDRAATHGPASLVLSDLSKQYAPTGRRRSADRLPFAVDHIDLTVEPGEFVTLLGPSGCGKTTTLRLIAGFERPTSGLIRIGGVDMTTLAPNLRPTSMVFQSYALFPHLSAWENVAFGLRQQHMPRREVSERVELAMATMNLLNLERRNPSQLSGGQQQRVALARALVTRPSLMLFDEPLSSLDAKLRVQMRDEIRHLQRRMGTTAIFVTHDQAEAMTMSDRIAVMHRGRIAQIGTPEEIYRQPKSLFVGDFVGRANFLEVRVGDVRGGRADVTVFGAKHHVAAHPEVTAGSRAIMLIRPEALIARPAGADAPTARCGQVVAATYYGSSIEYEIESIHGRLLGAAAPGQADRRLTDGMQAMVEFDETEVWVMPDEQRPEDLDDAPLERTAAG